MADGCAHGGLRSGWWREYRVRRGCEGSGGVDDVNLQKIARILEQSAPIQPQLKYISYKNKATY